MAYHKPWQSYGIQLDRLAARGMQITDRALALDYLERIGYYRLSGYWFAFRQRSARDGIRHLPPGAPSKSKDPTLALEQFKPGASFQNAVDLYVFDKQLRLLTMDALERIEISLRVDISHTLGALDAFAYLRPELFHDDFSGKLDKHSGVTRLTADYGIATSSINQSCRRQTSVPG
jgi:abortive infection bacteriophage resistance protein